jgi:hypothetical protein
VIEKEAPGLTFVMLQESLKVMMHLLHLVYLDFTYTQMFHIFRSGAEYFALNESLIKISIQIEIVIQYSVMSQILTDMAVNHADALNIYRVLELCWILSSDLYCSELFSLVQITPFAMLSRATAGIRGSTLVRATTQKKF